MSPIKSERELCNCAGCARRRGVMAGVIVFLAGFGWWVYSCYRAVRG